MLAGCARAFVTVSSWGRDFQLGRWVPSREPHQELGCDFGRLYGAQGDEMCLCLSLSAALGSAKTSFTAALVGRWLSVEAALWCPP